MRINKKRALFITTMPLAKDNGGGVYTHTVYQALSVHYEVQPFELSKHQYIANSKIRWLYAIIKSVYTLVPPNVLFHSAFCRALAPLFTEHWDLIVFDRMESSFAKALIGNTPAIYISHNRESNLLRYKIPKAPGWIISLVSNWIDRYEASLASDMQGVISISSQEAEWYRQFSSNVKVLWPIFDKIESTINENNIGLLRLGFIGPKSWYPNYLSFKELIDNILPNITRECHLIIAGKGWNKEDFSSLKSSPNIKVSLLGFVPDVDDFWRNIDVLMAPILDGAGTNVKVCEALAKDTAVIGYSHAFRGLDEKILHSSNAAHVTTPEDFCREIEYFNIDAKNLVEISHYFSTNYADKAVLDLLSRVEFPK